MAPHNELIKQRYEEYKEQKEIEEIFEIGENFQNMLNSYYQEAYEEGFKSEEDFMKFASKKIDYMLISHFYGDNESEALLTLNNYNIFRAKSGEIVQLVILKENELNNIFSEEK